MSSDEAPVFSLRAERDEDLRAAAAEYEEWLNEKLSIDPDPQTPMQTPIKVTVSRAVQVGNNTIVHQASAEVEVCESECFEELPGEIHPLFTYEERAARLAAGLFAALPRMGSTARALAKTLDN